MKVISVPPYKYFSYSTHPPPPILSSTDIHHSHSLRPYVICLFPFDDRKHTGMSVSQSLHTIWVFFLSYFYLLMLPPSPSSPRSLLPHPHEAISLFRPSEKCVPFFHLDLVNWRRNSLVTHSLSWDPCLGILIHSSRELFGCCCCGRVEGGLIPP